MVYGFLRKFGEYPAEELRKRYTEASRKQDFVSRHLLLAECCINMEARAADGSVTYNYSLEADYLDPKDEYHFLCESELILFLLPVQQRLIYAKRYAQKIWEDIGQDDNENVCIRFCSY